MSGERFRIVEGGARDLSQRKPRSSRRTVWECRICEPVQGVRSRYMTTVTQDATEDSRGRIAGGRKIQVCAICMVGGVFTPVTS